MKSMDKLVEQEQEAMDRHRLDSMIRRFAKNWAPEDRDDRTEFETDLFSLVRQIYRDAQEPLVKQMAAAMALVPFPPLPIPKKPEPRTDKP